MRKSYPLGLLAASVLTAFGPALAQSGQKLTPRTAYQQFALRQRMLPAQHTICYHSLKNEFTRVVPQRPQRSGARQAPTAQISVEYNNFSPEAQRAFQYAVDIWANLISSPIPIRIRANWVTQQPGVLGSAGPTTTWIGVDGAQKAFGDYPVALAEKIARRQLNNPNEPDISASFNRNNTWYYGTDANPPSGQTDLVSVVLHEIGHGLGVIGGFGVQGNQGQYFRASVFDHFVENAQGQRLLDEERFPNVSSQLFQQLTGNNLFFNGPILQQRTGQKAKLFAPSSFDRGSSIYHTDETTYPPGDINSLMSPQIGFAEAIHTPGPLVLGMFRDMEWVTTSVLHTPLEESEDVRDVVFSTRIVSDTGFAPNSVRFFIRRNPTSLTAPYIENTPTRVGNTNEYRFTLPAAQAMGRLEYYFQAQDVAGRPYTNPGKNYVGGQVPHRVVLGPDNVAPTIRHEPARRIIFAGATADSLNIFAEVRDDRNLGTAAKRGVDTVFVEYQLNGVAQPTLPLRYVTPSEAIPFDSIWGGQLRFGANTLRAGTTIRYRIVARDLARGRNQAATPFYEVAIVAPQPTIRRDYATTFAEQNVSADFVGNGFSITTPAGFTDPAIHSDHPYRNGNDFRNEANYEYYLLAPIRVKDNPDSATIRFDEIVLVEPGGAGSRFGDDDFFDYVIVEASRNGGRTWFPIIDGYDSRDNADWLRAYNERVVQGDPGQPLDQNSQTVGTPRLFKRREIRLVGGGGLQFNEVVLLRFRLFADQFAHGWGWAIDNLAIQTPPPPPVLSVEPTNPLRLTVFPNPANDVIQAEATLTNAATDANWALTSPTGQTLWQKTAVVSGKQLREQIDVSRLPAGLYFLRLKAGDSVQTRKVMVVK